MRVIILSHPDLITKWVCLEKGRDTVKIHGVALHKREARVIKERRFLTKEEMEIAEKCVQHMEKEQSYRPHVSRNAFVTGEIG